MSNASRRPLTEEAAWQKLQSLYDTQSATLNMRNLFAQDPSRFSKYSHTLQTPDGEILFDFSKNLITEEILKTLLELVKKKLFIYSGGHLTVLAILRFLTLN
jgi:glucose-6-phosphate isomerase